MWIRIRDIVNPGSGIWDGKNRIHIWFGGFSTDFLRGFPLFLVPVQLINISNVQTSRIRNTAFPIFSPFGSVHIGTRYLLFSKDLLSVNELYYMGKIAVLHCAVNNFPLDAFTSFPIFFCLFATFALLRSCGFGRSRFLKLEEPLGLVPPLMTRYFLIFRIVSAVARDAAPSRPPWSANQQSTRLPERGYGKHYILAEFCFIFTFKNRNYLEFLYCSVWNQKLMLF